MLNDDNLNKNVDDNLSITRSDFDLALKDSKPMFGNNISVLSKLFDKCKHTIDDDDDDDDYNEYSQCIKSNNNIPKVITQKDDKLGYAIKLCMETKFTIKVISSYDLIGKSESDKINLLNTYIHECYEAEHAVLLITDLDNLVNYSYLQHNIAYSNNIMQNIIAICSAVPPYNTDLTIILNIHNDDLIEYIDERLHIK